MALGSWLTPAGSRAGTEFPRCRMAGLCPRSARNAVPHVLRRFGHTVNCFNRPQEAIENPYNTVHPSARVARARNARKPSRYWSEGVGSLWRVPAYPAHRAMPSSRAMPRRQGPLIFRQGIRLPSIASFGVRLWNAASRAAHPGGVLRTGFSIQVHELERRLFGSWVVKSPRGVFSRVITGWKWQRASATDRAPGVGSTQAVSGVKLGGTAAKRACRRKRRNAWPVDTRCACWLTAGPHDRLPIRRSPRCVPLWKILPTRRFVRQRISLF